MISFKMLLEEDLCKLRFAYSSDFEEKIQNLLSEYGQGNVAVCLELPCPAVRIFDGREYFFLYPASDREEDSQTAVQKIAEYAVKEEIGLVFRGVPSRELASLCGAFCYCNIMCENPERSTYSVRMRSEADLLQRIPTVRAGGVALSMLKKKDIANYARICREESALVFWGYDYREDEPSAPDEYFYNTSLSEFNRGVSMTFGVRRKGELIGEASFYAFDYTGGAEIGFRLLPQYRGRGLGRATLEALLIAGEQIGLNTIYATVDKRNSASLSLLSDYMDRLEDSEGLARFILRGEQI